MPERFDRPSLFVPEQDGDNEELIEQLNSLLNGARHFLAQQHVLPLPEGGFAREEESGGVSPVEGAQVDLYEELQAAIGTAEEALKNLKEATAKNHNRAQENVMTARDNLAVALYRATNPEV